jgi:WhiB family redox-sensing transcriptional regulator
VAIASIGGTWWRDAACRGFHETHFIPPSSREKARDRKVRENKAKQICAECPVLAECRAYAFRVDERLGIWGGLTERERAQVTEAHRQAS